MEKEYIKIKTEKPKTRFSKNTDVLKTKDDKFWKDWIFYCLLSFYQEFDRKILKQKIEKIPSRVEKTIADFIRDYLIQNPEFDGVCGFIINREPLNDGNIEGYYDIKIQHSSWKNRMFCFECKNLKEKQDLINKYVYHNKENQIFDGGVYRFFNGKYAQNQDFGGMIGFVLEGNYLNIKAKIHEKLNEKFDISPEGDLVNKKIADNSIQENDFTFDSYHHRKNREFVIHHLLFCVR